MASRRDKVIPYLKVAGLRRVLISMVCGVMSGCASMSGKDCLSTNWQDQGYRDGRMGFALSRLQDHRQACQKVGINPDAAYYQTGYDVGIQEYCAPANAIREGRLGRSYQHSCPMSVEREFLSYYERGYWAYRSQQKLDGLHREMSQTQSRLDKETNHDQRQTLRRELRDLDQQLKRARDELNDAERRLQLDSLRW